MADIKPQQILLPKQVYIGDTAELRCTFNSNELILKQLTMNGAVEINTEAFVTGLDAKDYEILQVNLAPTGIDYFQISVTFKPWKTGLIQFPQLRLGDAVISFQPVEIVSITQTTKENSLKDSQSPLLLPGTTYRLYGLLIAAVILLIAAIELIIKRKAVASAIYRFKQNRKFRKNKKQTLKSISNLPLDNHKVWAESIQKILRNYLEIRFDYPFTKAAASELMNGFYKATNQVFTEKKEAAFEEIANSFIRTDYIRYKENELFSENEMSELTKMIIHDIEIIEGAENA